MKITTWEKKILSGHYNIFQGTEFIGFLTTKLFSRLSSGELEGKSYEFIRKGIFGQETLIFDHKNNKMIGSMSRNSLMTRGTIIFEDRAFFWKYDNFWCTQWSIMDEKGVKVRFSSVFTRGQVFSENEHPLLVLAGLQLGASYAIFVALFMFFILIVIL